MAAGDETYRARHVYRLIEIESVVGRSYAWTAQPAGIGYGSSKTGRWERVKDDLRAEFSRMLRLHHVKEIKNVRRAS